jgi:AcrR family transcriptional regulator
MDPKKRRENHRKSQHTKIIKAALSTANKEGWKGLSMRKISNIIGYTLPVIYQHFKSKEDIIQQVAIEGFLKLQASFDDVVSKTKEGKLKIKKVIQAYVDFAISNKVYYEAMYGITGVQSVLKTDRIPEGKQVFDFLIASSKEILPKEINTEIFLKYLWSNVHGLVSLHSIDLIDNPETGLKIQEILDYMLLQIDEI